MGFGKKGMFVVRTLDKLSVQGQSVNTVHDTCHCTAMPFIDTTTKRKEGVPQGYEGKQSIYE